jgi:signal transduction histidine kinase
MADATERAREPHDVRTPSTERTRTPSPVLVLVAATMLVGAAFAWAISHRVDAPSHDAYQDRLGRLLTLQHRLNEQVLRAHAGLVGSYDPLVRTTRELRDLHRELAVVPAFVSIEGRAHLVERLTRSREALAAMEEIVERFKSRNAVLLNSLRYFPVAASELASAMASEPESSDEAAQLREALRDVLRVAVFPTEEAIADTTTHLRSIHPSGPHAEDVRLLLRHAEIITSERPNVDTLLAEILDQPGIGLATDLAEAYTASHQAALHAEERASYLFLASIVLGIVAVAASLLLRLREDARRIAQTSEQLAVSIDRQNRFVSMTSHEFRTPLSVIVSSADLLMAYGDRWGPEQHKKHLAKIERAGRAMTDLLDGMLLIGRTDAGHRDFRPQRVELGVLVAETVENQRARVKNGVTIEVSTSGVETPIVADPRLIKHALDNLVGNGVKYSREGGRVRVSIGCDGRRLAIGVEDQGIGIPLADQERLFDTFHRASNVGRVPGTGLGLAIVKRAVDLHGGTIHVESKEGVGTRFDLEIPVETAAERPSTERAERASEAGSPAAASAPSTTSQEGEPLAEEERA